MSARSNLYRVLDADGNLYRADDGTTRFPYIKASAIAERIGGTVVK